MKKLYPTISGKLYLAIFFSLLFSSLANAQIVTYDTTFNGWNAIVTEDLSLHGTDSAAGIVFFPGIDQMTTNINDLAVNGPHYLINNKIWDGSVTLGNGVHHPFIISLQPPGPNYPASEVMPKIQAILARYRIKRHSFYMTGLSLGAWQANEFVTYQPTIGDHTYGNLVKAIVNLEGVEPADFTGVYAGLPYPQKMGDWAQACGGREMWVEGSQDWRDLLAGQQSMTAAVRGSATYFQVTYGGGSHCCWNTEYEPSTTWTQPSNPNISILTGTPAPMNVWQWLLRQGDTSMPGTSTPPAVLIPPITNAGTGQTITLPSTSATLTGTATANGGATIKMTSWKEVSGPLTSTISGPSALTTQIGGLILPGTYVYQLTATDNDNLSTSSTVTVVVDPAPILTPPTVSAGGDPVITLPVSTVTLSGTAAGTNGATVASTAWKQTLGPVTAKIASPSSLTTAISGLTVAGTYIFQLTVTANTGLQSSSTVVVVVSPAIVVAAKPTPPAVSAGAGQTITLPTNSLTLSGTATGTNGATVNSYYWQMISGPSWVSFGNAWAPSTGVGGLVAGTYVFQFSASDNHLLTSASTMTVVVNAAAPPKVTAPVAPGSPATSTANASGAAKAPPTVNAGDGKAITLPLSSINLLGSAAGVDGASIVSIVWSQESGPKTAVIAAPGNLATAVSGMTVAGSYIFKLTVVDNKGESSNAAMTVFVEPSIAKVPPTVNAGDGKEITLPVSSESLLGSAAGVNGATIISIIWIQESGPKTAVIADPGHLTTTVSGLTVAGNYVFKLTVIDNNGESSNASMTVFVEPSIAKVPPTVSAGSNMTVTLPTSSVTLDGSATGHNGAVVNSYFWNMISGPTWVKFSNEWASTTTVSGLVAGTYVFQLSASDNNIETSAASMTLVVKAQSTSAAAVGSTAVGANALELTDSTGADSAAMGVLIYPNPAHNLLNVRLNNVSTGKVVVMVFNMNGQRVQAVELAKEGYELDASLDISRLVPGVYVLEIMTGRIKTTQKFIKQ